MQILLGICYVEEAGCIPCLLLPVTILHKALGQLDWLSEVTFYVERTAKICVTFCVYMCMPPLLCLIYRLFKPMCTACIPKNKQFSCVSCLEKLQSNFL